MVERMSKNEQDSLWKKLRKAGLITGVAMVGIGFVFGIPGLIAGGLVDFGIAEPNIKAAGQTYEKWKKKRGKK
ncbi:MAG: hypothetical protein ACE5DQ_01890 [Candidatus Paceibacterota bacterium]